MPVSTRVMMGDFNRAASLALEDTVSDYLSEVDELMGSDVWGWPNDTKRANGQTAGTIRDVIDRGTLADPGNREDRVTGLSAGIVWLAPYSAPVFLGAVFKRRALTLPARNVPRAALESLGIGRVYSGHLARRLR